MNKPNPKDYPPQTPHDLEWGGVSQKYYEDLRRWEELNTTNSKQQPPPELLDNTVINNMFDQAYNTAVEHCIEVVKELGGTEPLYNKFQVCKELTTKLEQLKKQTQ